MGHVPAGQPGHGAALRRGGGPAAGGGPAGGLRPDPDQYGGVQKRAGSPDQRLQQKCGGRKDCCDYETEKTFPGRPAGGSGAHLRRKRGLCHLGGPGGGGSAGISDHDPRQ